MKNSLQTKFKIYLENTNSEQLRSVWSGQSRKFIDFWKNKIMDDTYPSLSDSEIDEIVLILDKKAKGSTKDHFAVANVMIPQGVWRRLFKEIKQIKRIKSFLNKIFTSENDEEKIATIDKLYEFNQGRKNSLTGKSGNAINSMLFAYSPKKYLAVVSLNDRKKIIDFYQFSHYLDLINDTQGKKIILTNEIIMNGFKEKGIETTPLVLSNFLYNELKDDWRISDNDSEVTYEDKIEYYNGNDTSFHLENELEIFLIANWDKTELAKDYELIEENGELVCKDQLSLLEEYPEDLLEVVFLNGKLIRDDSLANIRERLNLNKCV